MDVMLGACTPATLSGQRNQTHSLLIWSTPNKIQQIDKSRKIYGNEINQNLFLTSVAGCELCKQCFHSENENGK